MSDYAIILAGGKGLRMGTDVPKQFLPVAGVPVLMRTLRRFRDYSEALRIILVLPEAQHDYWRQLCRDYAFCEDYEVAPGGPTRFHSIQNGLSLIPDGADGVVCVHDGVRPFPSTGVITNCYDVARQTGTAVPVIPVVETLRHIDKQSDTPTGAHAETIVSRSHTVPRDEYCLVQTPQAFRIDLHKQAYRQPYRPFFTDDASVVEALGTTDITLVEGNRENIKITTPFDLSVAEAIVAHEEAEH